jgi:predicted phage tail component-like protein
MTTDVTLNGVTLASAVPTAAVLDVRRPLAGRRRDVYVEVPGRPGSYVYPEAPGDRELGIVVDIAADTMADRRAAVIALADWCDLGVVAPLIIDDQDDRYHEALLASGPDVLERLLSAATELRFRVTPYALAIEVTSTSVGVTGTSPYAAELELDGNVAVDPIIEITPTDGTITGFTLTVGDRALTWSGVIADDQTLTISSISDTATVGVNGDTMLTGAYNQGAVSMADMTGDFPIVEPGTNDWSLEWTGTATTITVEFTWRERYR